MITMIDLCVAAQKRVIDVHEQSLQAARKTLDSAQAAVDMQKAMNEAASANVNAWQNWLSLWGWRK
jgi:chemotaxis regulatin CheY-phosphate phosphatase CheZ